jgi:AraC-like DNA-binding protein
MVVFPRRGTFFRHGPEHAQFADPNFVLFFNAGDPFSISYPQPGGDDSTFFTLDAQVLREILAEHQPRLADTPVPRFPVAQMLSDPDLFLAHGMLLRKAQGRSTCNLLSIEEGVLRLLGRVAIGARNGTNGHRGRTRSATRRAHRDVAENVKAILADRFRDRLTLSEVANAAKVSPYHLCRIFAREVGMPIHRYLNRLRLRDSLWQLAERQTSLTDLALDLGYSSHSHFTDAFRREFGVSPNEFRRGTVALEAAAR